MLNKFWNQDMATASYKVVLLGEGKYKYDDITILDMTFLMFRLCWKGLGSRKLQCMQIF